MFTKKLFRFVAFAAAFTLSFSACQEDIEPTPTVYFDSNAMIVHAGIDAPAVDFSINGTKKNSDSLVYGAASPYYTFTYDSTQNRIKFLVKTSLSGATLYNDSILVNKNSNFSFFAYVNDDPAKTRTIKPVVDNLAAPSTGKAKLRIGQFVGDAPTNYNIELVAVGGVATTRNDFSAVAFKTVTDFIEITPGSYDIKVKRADATGGIDRTISNITFASGKIYTVVTRGLVARANGFQATVISNN